MSSFTKIFVKMLPGGADFCKLKPKLHLKRRKIGAILIEFAFSIPVFLVLMYYIHDLPKMKLMLRKNQFVANIMAASIQNVSKQCLAQERNFTITDLKNIIRLGWIPVFQGMTQYSSGKNVRYMPLGILPLFNLICFSGAGNNMAKLEHYYRIYNNDGQIFMTYVDRPDICDTIININATNAKEIYKDFTIQTGEIKVIVDVNFHNEDNWFFGTTGVKTNTVSKGKLFGFLFYNPISRTGRKFGYFDGITIFTPIWDFRNKLSN